MVEDRLMISDWFNRATSIKMITLTLADMKFKQVIERPEDTIKELLLESGYRVIKLRPNNMNPNNLDVIEALCVSGIVYDELIAKGAPDFLVIDTSTKDFWFIEVKRYGDNIHKEQYRWYFRNPLVKILVVVI